ncbi:MAG: DUF4493 domain-containing protein [Muribaculaceae bacterium]|nr:DUF4493 domain-containing protein [Muribaculaceae bacterium]
MKKVILTGTSLLVAVALGFSGCSDDPSPYGDGASGSVVPTVSLDSRVTSSDGPGQMNAPASRSVSRAMEITPDELTLTLTPKDGSAPFTCTGVSAFPVDKEFKVGEYTFEVSYGNPEAEGFDMPAYYGSEILIVEENRTSSVSVTAVIVNSMVSVEFGDGLKQYATDLSAHLQTTGDKIAFSTSETRAAYVNPGPATVSVTLTKPNGVSGTVTIPVFTAKARYHHHVKLDLDGGAGDAVLNVTFDDTVETEDVEIELSDEILNSPAPVATAQGFVTGEPVSFVAGLGGTENLAVDITAQASIASVVMATKSASLLEQGWPAEIDLTKATADQQAKLKALGLDVLGLFKNPGRMAVVDFSNVVSHIVYKEGADNLTEISLTVLDQASKSAEPVVLALNALPLEMSIKAITEQYPEKAGDPIELQLGFNGNDPAKEVSFQYFNERGTWAPLEVISITPLGRAADLYSVLVKAPDIDFSVEIRAVCGALTAKTESVVVKQVPFRLLASDAASYAHSTMLTVVSSTLNAANVAKAGTLKLSPEAPDMAVSVNGASITVTGLASGTTYSASFVYDGEECGAVSFTTESERQLHDAGFDAWTSKKLEDDCYQYLWTVGDGSTWATVNDLTTSQHGNGVKNGLNCKGAAYKATSGTIPANSRSTKTQDGGGIIGTTKSGDGNTVGDANLHSNMQSSGANAALVRTVGWGSGNGASSSSGGFGTCNNVTPGELFLGSYNGEPAYGIEFNVRPKEVSFMYHYDVVTPGNGDYASVEVKLYDVAGEEIASASENLTEQTSWVNKTLTLTYTKTDRKAAKISIAFKSSANPDVQNQKNSTWMRHPGSKNISGGEFVGSELYIDDVTLKY